MVPDIIFRNFLDSDQMKAACLEAVSFANNYRPSQGKAVVGTLPLGIFGSLRVKYFYDNNGNVVAQRL